MSLRYPVFINRLRLLLFTLLIGLNVNDAVYQPIKGFTQHHPSSVIFINKYGKVISCDAKIFMQELYDHYEIYWQVLIDGQWQRAEDVAELRSIKPNGHLIFHPFDDYQFQDKIHNTQYQCLIAFKYGVIGTTWIKVKAITEKPIQVQTEDEHVRLGTNVVVRCLIPKDYLGYVYISGWMTDNGHIILPPYTYTNDIVQATPFKRKYIVLSNGQLLILNVDHYDLQRRFRCQVAKQFTGERIESANWAQLILAEHRQIPSSPQLPNKLDLETSIIIEEGESFLLHCPFQGWPEPKMTWYFANGPNIRSLGETKFIKLVSSLLYLSRFTSKDSGRYICSASNSHGQGQYEVELIDKNSFNLLLSTSSSNINIGQELTLNCSLIKSYSNEVLNSSLIKEIVWFKNMRKIKYSHRVRLLEPNILNIRKFEYSDNGVYQCYFKISDYSNTFKEKWLQASTLITVEERAPSFGAVFSEQIEISGSHASFKCLALGQPIPSIKWKIDGVQVTNNHRYNVQTLMTTDGKGSISIFNITSLNNKDGGSYECLASNSAGTVSHQSRVNIIGPPGIKYIENMTAIQGDTYTLHCPYYGYPIDEVYFTKDNKRLPFDERHVHVGLGKVNISSINKDDQGLYKCIVVLLNSERSEMEFNLNVIAPPVLSPFSFPDNLEEGMRISIVCSVISGDSPITIKWFKNGQLIDKNIQPKYQIAVINEYVSSLIMNKVDKYYNGNYTCQSSNTLSSVNHTALLMIKSRSFFILKPIPKMTTIESSVLFDCQAEGYPESVIRWKFSSVSSPSEPISILSSPRIHVLENGSLLIKSVTHEDQGNYFCEASNNIGKSVTVSTFLKIYEPPKIRPMDDKMIVKKGQKVDLFCHSTASLPFIVEWLKNSESIISNTNYLIREEGIGNQKLSTLTIKTCTRNDTAVFRCVVTNFYKQSVSSIKLIVQEPSDPPVNLQILQIKSKSVSLSWSIGFHGNSPIIGFEIDYRKSSDSWSESKTLYTNENSANTAVLLNLVPSTSYHVRIRAENEIGKSDYSEPMHFITRMEAPTIVPENVTTMPLDCQSIKIKWIINGNLKSNHIDGFYIGNKEYGSSDAFNYNTMYISQENGHGDIVNRFGHSIRAFEFVIHSLRKSTKYSIIVQAFNKEGEGSYSEEVTAETFENDPPKRVNLHLENSSTESASLIWDILPQEEDNIDGFILSYKSEKYEKDLHDNIKLPKTYRRYLLSNLDCGTKYSVSICAYNRVGNGEPSPVLKFTTQGKAPTAADKWAFISSNITTVILNLATWFDGNCPISHFKMQYKPRIVYEWILLSNYILPEQEKIEIDNLIPGTWYDLSVTAKNDAGSTEANYLFATLTLSGATVAPLLSNEYKSFFGGLLVLIPSVTAIIVLLLVAGFAIYLIFLRNMRNRASSADQYTSQREDTFSLHSYRMSKLDSIQEPVRTSTYLPSVYSACLTDHNDIQSTFQPSQTIDDDYRCMLNNRFEKKSLYEHVYNIPHRYPKECDHNLMN